MSTPAALDGAQPTQTENSELVRMAQELAAESGETLPAAWLGGGVEAGPKPTKHGNEG